jgi:hypothetical protein
MADAWWKKYSTKKYHQQEKHFLNWENNPHKSTAIPDQSEPAATTIPNVNHEQNWTNYRQYYKAKASSYQYLQPPNVLARI